MMGMLRTMEIIEIKLTSHTLKIWQSIFVERLTKIVIITANECRLTSDVRTTDAFHPVKILMEKYKFHKQDHMVIKDLEKVLGRVPRELI